MRRIAAKTGADSPSAIFVAYVASLHRAVHGLGLYFEATNPGITQAEVTVLLYLRTAVKPTINDVHRAFSHRRSTLTSVLDRIEKRGFVTRAPSADDRRSLTLALTSAGRKAADRIATTLAKLEREIDSPRTKVAAAARLLERTAEISAETVD